MNCSQFKKESNLIDTIQNKINNDMTKKIRDFVDIPSSFHSYFYRYHCRHCCSCSAASQFFLKCLFFSECLKLWISLWKLAWQVYYVLLDKRWSWVLEQRIYFQGETEIAQFDAIGRKFFSFSILLKSCSLTLLQQV